MKILFLFVLLGLISIIYSQNTDTSTAHPSDYQNKLNSIIKISKDQNPVFHNTQTTIKNNQEVVSNTSSIISIQIIKPKL